MKLKRFDVWQKPKVDEVLERTIFGAVLSAVSIGLVIVLVISEFSAYMKTDVASHMVLDTLVGVSNTRIDVDLSFDHVECDRIDFTQEITRGQHHGPPNESGDIHKITDGDGCHVFGSIVTDKIGGNFKFAVLPTESEKTAAAEEIAKKPRDPFMPPYNARMFMPAPDISHTINHVFFRDITETTKDAKNFNQPPHAEMTDANHHPLNGVKTIYPETLKMGIHHYGIQVVPTSFQPRRGPAVLVNQYSVTERQIEYMNALPAINIGGAYYQDFIGVVFNYDFYPVKLVMQEESKGSIFEFLAGLCGIVGGVVTVLGLIEGAVHHSAKAIIGKKD